MRFGEPIKYRPIFYNLQCSSTSNKSPFGIITRQLLPTPHNLMIGNIGSSPLAYHFVKEWHQNINITHTYLENVAKRMKKGVDLGRWLEEFKVDDLELVKLQPALL